MLTEDQKDQIRDSLEAERRRILDNAQAALGFSMDRDRDRIGRDSIDESVEEEMYSIEMRLHDREKYLLNKISQALQRLETDEIDLCEDCDEAIGFRRLLARPVTTLCIACKEEREAAEVNEKDPEDRMPKL